MRRRPAIASPALRQGVAALGFIVVAGVQGGVPARASDGAVTRRTTAPYGSPAAGAWVFLGGYEVSAYAFNCAEAWGCATFELQPRDAFASFEVRDATGLPVFASIWDDEFLGGNLLGTFCGKTPEPVDLQGRRRIFVHVTPGTCPDLTPSAPTSSVVEATFYL